jgi:hypothetical protein
MYEIIYRFYLRLIGILSKTGFFMILFNNTKTKKTCQKLPVSK